MPRFAGEGQKRCSVYTKQSTRDLASAQDADAAGVVLVVRGVITNSAFLALVKIKTGIAPLYSVLNCLVRKSMM